MCSENSGDIFLSIEYFDYWQEEAEGFFIGIQFFDAEEREYWNVSLKDCEYKYISLYICFYMFYINLKSESLTSLTLEERLEYDDIE